MITELISGQKIIELGDTVSNALMNYPITIDEILETIKVSGELAKHGLIPSEILKYDLEKRSLHIDITCHTCKHHKECDMNPNCLRRMECLEQEPLYSGWER